MTLKEWQESIINDKNSFETKNVIYKKILTNKIEIINKTDEDFLIHGTYLSKNKCLITVLRFDESSGWKPLKMRIDDEIIELNSSKTSNCSYNIETKTILTYNIINYQQKIPKKIIQTNKTKDVSNIIQYNSIKSFELLNPEYEYLFFDDVDCRSFIKTNFDVNVVEAYDILIPGAFKADLFRYCYLYKYGGCYFDYKIIARCPLRNIIKSDDEILLCEDYNEDNSLTILNKSYLNAIIMCVPNRDDILKLICVCVENIINKQKLFYHVIKIRATCDILDLTGPTLMYKIINDKHNFVKFKHIIINHDRTNYKNHQIVDINSGKLLFHKTNNCSSSDYNKLCCNYEVFFINRIQIKDLIIYVYPHHHHPDMFNFNIDENNKMEIERIDSNEKRWDLNLIIKVINNITSKSIIYNIGNNINSHQNKSIENFII